MTQKKEKNGRGRPPKPEGDRRKCYIQLRVTSEELQRYREAAGDRPVSEFLRRLADDASELQWPANSGGYNPITGDYDDATTT